VGDPTLALAGTAAPPRRNGELVFEAPWESRLFGLTFALYEAGLFGWEEFRALLCQEIGAWEEEHPSREGFRYYTCWQAAFERLLSEKGLCSFLELDDLTRALAARPTGHDHPEPDGTGQSA
jgi:nitrile hydratase accessory protein